MPAYSSRPLAQKLGLKEGSKVLAVNAPAGYLTLLDPMPAGVEFQTGMTGSTDIVHVFSTSKEDLRVVLQEYRGQLRPDGAVWVSWPKQAAKVATDITDNVVREVALPMGFVDIKVCSVDDVWSGLKLVIRRACR